MLKITRKALASPVPDNENAPTAGNTGASEPIVSPPHGHDRRLWLVDDVACQFHVTPRTIRNWILRGELPAIQIGRRYWIDDQDVARFLAKRRHTQ